MHKEVSLAIEIAVALLALSALIGIITFTMFLGKNVSNDVSVEATEIMGRTDVATLEDLCKRGTVSMPIAAAYNILKMNNSRITKFNCNCTSDCISNGDRNLATGESICVSKHLDNPLVVNVTVEKDVTGGYSVIIRR